MYLLSRRSKALLVLFGLVAAGLFLAPRLLRPAVAVQVTQQLSVNFVGPLSGLSGLAESARSYLRVFVEAKVKVRVEDFQLKLLKAPPGHPQLGVRSNINFLHLNVVGELDLLLQKPGFVDLLEGRYNIAVVYWEVEFPALHVSVLARMNEIWCPSPFLKRMLEKSCPQCKTRLVRPFIKEPMIVRANRARFGLPRKSFVFFFNFDPDSDIDRKNPLAFVKAFDQEFSEQEDVLCFVKMKRTSRKHPQLSALASIARTNQHVLLVARSFERWELNELYSAIDCYVSPHRSEGLGLTILEAMLRKKPVIATGYGGVADVTREPFAFPVEFDIVPVGKGYPNYAATSTWGDPRIQSLRQRMREVFDDQKHARRVAERGAARVRRVFAFGRSSAAILRAMADINAAVVAEPPVRKWFQMFKQSA